MSRIIQHWGYVAGHMIYQYEAQLGSAEAAVWCYALWLPEQTARGPISSIAGGEPGAGFRNGIPCYHITLHTCAVTPLLHTHAGLDPETAPFGAIGGQGQAGGLILQVGVIT